MTLLRKANKAIFLRAAIMVLAFTMVGRAQTLETKLSWRVSFAPQSSSAPDQLVEVAQHYKIPMGIERVGEDGKDSSQWQSEHLRRLNRLTVRGLIVEILKELPGYRATVADGILLIGKPEVISSSRNFLNIRIAHYEVSNESVYGAEFELRMAIGRTLEPDKYARGWGGGYGHAPGTVLATDNISINLRNATVRAIMSEIIRQNGRAMWTVHLIPARTKPGAPYFGQDDWPTPGFQWRFIPLDETQTK